MHYDGGMVVDLKPETERLLLEEIQNGQFSSLDEIIESGVSARRLGAGPVKTRAEAVAHIRAIQRRNVLPPGVTIRDLIDEGRD